MFPKIYHPWQKGDEVRVTLILSKISKYLNYKKRELATLWGKPTGTKVVNIENSSCHYKFKGSQR